MKKSSIFLALPILALISSCSHTKPFAVQDENSWFIHSGMMSSYPIYCMANKKENSAEPVCYEPIRVEYKIQTNSTNQVSVILTPAAAAPQPQVVAPAEPQAPSSPSADPRTGPMKSIQKEPTQNILSL